MGGLEKQKEQLFTLLAASLEVSLRDEILKRNVPQKVIPNQPKLEPRAPKSGFLKKGYGLWGHEILLSKSGDPMIPTESICYKKQ